MGVPFAVIGGLRVDEGFVFLMRKVCGCPRIFSLVLLLYFVCLIFAFSDLYFTYVRPLCPYRCL